MRTAAVLLASAALLSIATAAAAHGVGTRKVVYLYRVDVSGLRADVTASGGDQNVQATSQADWSARFRAKFVVDRTLKTAAMIAVPDTEFHGTAIVKGAYDDTRSGQHYTCATRNLIVSKQLGKLLLGGTELGAGRFGLKVTPSLAFNPGIPLRCEPPTPDAGQPQTVSIGWNAFAGTQPCIFPASAEYRLVVPFAGLGKPFFATHEAFTGAPAGVGCTGTSMFFGPLLPATVRDTGVLHLELKLLSKRVVG